MVYVLFEVRIEIPYVIYITVSLQRFELEFFYQDKLSGMFSNLNVQTSQLTLTLELSYYLSRIL
jgi:hypothetical protein